MDIIVITVVLIAIFIVGSYLAYKMYESKCLHDNHRIEQIKKDIKDLEEYTLQIEDIKDKLGL